MQGCTQQEAQTSIRERMAGSGRPGSFPHNASSVTIHKHSVVSAMQAWYRHVVVFSVPGNFLATNEHPFVQSWMVLLRLCLCWCISSVILVLHRAWNLSGQTNTLQTQAQRDIFVSVGLVTGTSEKSHSHVKLKVNPLLPECKSSFISRHLPVPSYKSRDNWGRFCP